LDFGRILPRSARGGARLADVSNNTVINIEAGKQDNPTIETLKKVANALQIGVDDLIK